MTANRSTTMTFRGDRRKSFDPKMILGPSARDGRRFTITKMTYDEATDTSTATLTPVKPAEFRGLLEPRVANAQEAIRLRNLFHD